jgi:hypothetical protein
MPRHPEHAGRPPPNEGSRHYGLVRRWEGGARLFLELPLMRQERRALHEKHREGRHSDVPMPQVVFMPRRLSGFWSK